MAGRSLMCGQVARSGWVAAALTWTACLAWHRAAADEPAISIVTTRPQPMMANLGDAYSGVRLGADRDAFERCSAALAEHHDLDFRATSLRDAVARIADKAGIAIGFDHESLEDSGFDVDVASVTGTFNDMSLRATLHELLGDLDLGLVFRNERLVVTTAEAAERHVVRFFYPVLAGTDVDELIPLIERTVAPDSWDTVGGKGAIMPLPGQMGTGLVISQTDAVHADIASLLQGLDAALWMPDQVDEGVEPRFVRTYLVADPLVRESAVEHLVDFCNEALPHGADPRATVDVFGDSLVVRSKSRAFQVMAAQMLASVQGVDAILLEEDMESDEAEPEAAAPGGAHATRFRKAGLP